MAWLSVCTARWFDSYWREGSKFRIYRRSTNIPIGLQLMNTKGQAEETNSGVALASVPLVLRLPGLASAFPYLK